MSASVAIPASSLSTPRLEPRLRPGHRLQLSYRTIYTHVLVGPSFPWTFDRAISPFHAYTRKAAREHTPAGFARTTLTAYVPAYTAASKPASSPPIFHVPPVDTVPRDRGPRDFPDRCSRCCASVGQLGILFSFARDRSNRRASRTYRVARIRMGVSSLYSN